MFCLVSLCLRVRLSRLTSINLIPLSLTFLLLCIHPTIMHHGWIHTASSEYHLLFLRHHRFCPNLKHDLPLKVFS